MYALNAQSSCSYDDFAESIRNIARLVDPDFRDCEIDLQIELYRLGKNADNMMTTMDTVIGRLAWIAYRAGHMALYNVTTQNITHVKGE